MNKENKICVIVLVMIALMIMVCLWSGYEGSDSCVDGNYADDEYVFVAQTPRIPAAVPLSTPRPTLPISIPTVKPSPEYNEIWCMTSINLYLYTDDGRYVDATSGAVELTMPYSEYDWTDDSTSIEDVVDAMGIEYEYVETVREKFSYPASDKYTGSGQYVVHIDGGLITMSVTTSATRYYTSYPTHNIEYHHTFTPVITRQDNTYTHTTTNTNDVYKCGNGQNILVGAYYVIECGYGCNIDCGHDCYVYCGRGCNIDCGDSCTVECGDGCNIAHGERCSISHGNGCNIWLAYPD